jgi:hypothetical protein
MKAEDFLKKCQNDLRASEEQAVAVKMLLDGRVCYLLLGCSVISVSFIICMLTASLMPLAGLHFCVGLDR